MDRSGYGRWCLNTLVFALSSALVACGGGGGGGSGSNPAPSPPVGRGFTVSTAAINHAASVAGDESLHEFLQVTITDTVAGQNGILGTYTSNGIASAQRSIVNTTTTEISLTFIAPHQIAPGVYQDTLRIGFCADAACMIFAGTPVEIPVTYTVTRGTLPTAVLARSTVEVTRQPWDVFAPPTASVVVTPTPLTRYFLSVTASHTSNGVASATYTQLFSDSGRIDIQFKPATQLSPGVYTDTVTVTACIDQACLYPLTVTPSVINATYNITSTVTGPQGYTARRSALAATDIAWSATRNTLYVAVPAQSPNYPSNVVELDPVTDTVGGTATLGFEPALLALADDGSLLYVAERDGDAIRRFTTAPLAADILISLGLDPNPPGNEELSALDMQVAPGQPRVLAVRRNNHRNGTSGRGNMIFDDAVARPNIATVLQFSDWGDMAWHPDGTRIFTNGAVLSVDAMGLTLLSSLPDSDGRLRYSNGLLYSDEREIVDPAGTITEFNTDGRIWAMTLDAGSNRAYLASSFSTSELLRIEVFDLLTRAPVAQALLPPLGANGRPERVVRFGTNGLAIVTTRNELILVQGPLVGSP